MTVTDISFVAGEETLAGRWIFSDGGKDKGVVLLHGAGESNKERALPLAKCLAAQHNINSFAFDFSGHGESSGSRDASSLTKRVEEAKRAIEVSGFKEPFALCAFSMGGHIALELLRDRCVNALILFYPAVYSSEAAAILFGKPEFTAAIRQPNSWRKSDVFEALSSFSGRLLVVIGENDEVIPKEVIELITTGAPQATVEQINIQGGTHRLLPSILGDETMFTDVCQKMAAAIRTYD
jgi:pimeloyl-ACP methyl ester carboxylesterase